MRRAVSRLKHRKPRRQTQDQRWPERSVGDERGPDDTVLNDDLQALRDLRRPLAPALHGPQVPDVELLIPQRLPKDICRSDGVLNGEIDADAANRRHGMCGIADRQQPRHVPCL